MRRLRLLRQWVGVCDMSPDYSPIMGETGADGFLITTGWGTWGFKAIPAGGEGMAGLIATGRAPDLIAPFSPSRFAPPVAVPPTPHHQHGAPPGGVPRVGAGGGLL